MKYDLTEFDKRVEQGFIRKVEKDGLVLYNYTDLCTYEKAWDEYTLAARGIIFEKATEKLIAKPFPKFFNLGEMPETQLLNLPNDEYTVTEKVDGSLGILYYYKDTWHVATRGSFNSTQAGVAEQLLYTQYDIDDLFPGLTYLVEIIYPENKIVVNYGDEAKLVFLSAIATHLDDVEVIENISPFPAAKVYNHTIEEMIELKKTLPKDQEGFVVRFKNGLRVKIKGDEYLRIHKMISTMSPISFWESMKDGKVNREYLQQLPEEFRSDFEPIVAALEADYLRVQTEIIGDVECVMARLDFPDQIEKSDLKCIGLLTQSENHGLRHPGAIFPYMLNKKEALDRYIMKTIRPTGNLINLAKVS